MNIVEQLTETLGGLCGDCQQKLKSLVGSQKYNASVRSPREAAIFLLAERIANENNMTRHEMKYGGKEPRCVKARLDFMREAVKGGFKKSEIDRSLGMHPGGTHWLLKTNKVPELKFPKPVRVPGKNFRPADCDEAEKNRRGYTNARSKVRLDGSERLVEGDWRRRKRSLRERSGGQCENIWAGHRCLKAAVDAHHIIRRSKWRDDRLSNLMDVCRECHKLLGGGK
jgi:hypothetical protein